MLGQQSNVLEHRLMRRFDQGQIFRQRKIHLIVVVRAEQDVLQPVLGLLTEL